MKKRKMRKKVHEEEEAEGQRKNKQMRRKCCCLAEHSKQKNLWPSAFPSPRAPRSSYQPSFLPFLLLLSSSTSSIFDFVLLPEIFSS